MGLLDGLKPFVPALQILDAIKNGDFKALLSSVSQLALTFATGGASALMGPLLNALTQFGSQALSTGLMNKIVSQVGQEFIQQMGEKMGLPQKAIDAAQAAFCESCGDRAGARANHREAGNLGEGRFWDRHTVSGAERRDAQKFLSAILGFANGNSAVGRGQADNAAGELTNNIQDAMQKLFNQMFDTDRAADGERRKKGPAKTDGNAVAAELGIDAGGFLMKFAILMGEALDNKTNEMMRVAEDMNQTSKSFADINTSKSTTGQQKFQKEMQEKGSKMQTLGAIMSGLSKEMDAMQNALKNALDSIGQAQSGLARRNG